jgi:hypothetical protein
MCWDTNEHSGVRKTAAAQQLSPAGQQLILSMGSTRLKSFIKMELLQKNVLKLRKL